MKIDFFKNRCLPLTNPVCSYETTVGIIFCGQCGKALARILASTFIKKRSVRIQIFAAPIFFFKMRSTEACIRYTTSSNGDSLSWISFKEFNRESARTARFILMATMISPTVNGESSSLAVSKVFNIFFMYLFNYFFSNI